MEIVTVGSSTDYRHYLSDVAVLTKTGDLNDPSPAIDYLHRDRLGSLTTITGKNGLNAQARGFDPFGKPRDGDWADRSPATLDSTITDRGFTEHEHLDDYELIHMNGRAYDYNLGRFLSVDPFIQSPGNSQSLNPYSYIMNKPLSGTDPSGYASVEEDVGKTAVKMKEERIPGSFFSRTTRATVTRTFEDGMTISIKMSGNANGSSASNSGKSGGGSGANVSADQINSQEQNARSTDPTANGGWSQEEGSFGTTIWNALIGIADSILEGQHYIHPDPAEFLNGKSFAELCECDYVSPFGEPQNNEAELGRDLAPAVGMAMIGVTRRPVVGKNVKVPNPGGRLGKPDTRQHVNQVGDELEKRGFEVTGGGGRLPEEYLPGPGGGRAGSNFPDITATKNGRTVRVNTIDTLKDGVTPTAREARAAAKIRAKTPGDHLILIPKPQ